MKFEDLKKEDQELLATDFGEEIEKEAAEKVAEAQELYQVGHNKFAEEAAKSMDEAEEKAKEESGEKDKEEAEKKLSDEEKKEAAARGQFIARGYIDGLKKLGKDKHQDELHYLRPFIEEKQASAVGALAGKASKALGKARSKAMPMSATRGAKSQAMAARAKQKEWLKSRAKKYGPAAAAGAALGGAAGYAAGKSSK